MMGRQRRQTAANPQKTLFDGASALPAVTESASSVALGKAQKQFNRLIAKIANQRQLLQAWRDYLPTYQQRIAVEFEPLRRELREARKAMVALLNGAYDQKTLTKRERAKVRDLLLGQLDELLAEAPEPELVQMYDAHSDFTFEEEQADKRDMAEVLASSLLGVELEEGEHAETPEAFAELMARKLNEARAAPPPPRRSGGKANAKAAAKAAAKEALREQAAHGASHALREVYRKLASALHPDRETDAAERARKTVLMQRVNQAYEARDLLALLELQLAIEQIDPSALSGLAAERLAHYNLVLEEQVASLQEEIDDIALPFTMMLMDERPGQVAPEHVQRALSADLARLQLALRMLRGDLARFQDLAHLKRSLRHYQIGQGEDIDPLEAMMMAEMLGRRR